MSGATTKGMSGATANPLRPGSGQSPLRLGSGQASTGSLQRWAGRANGLGPRHEPAVTPLPQAGEGPGVRAVYGNKTVVFD